MNVFPNMPGLDERVLERLPQTAPADDFNRALVEQVHPLDWTNPTPEGRYHLVVLGAGTAGLVTAAIAAGLGARVALVERDLMGGDCLNVGCVPSKALLAAARVARTVRRSDEFGITAGGAAPVDFEAVMARMRRLRSGLSPHDSASRFRELGVDVYLGAGCFTSPRTIDVEGQTLRFKKAVIATGARAVAPPIAGLDQVHYLTNETLFSLTHRPNRLGIIGAGPIGCEMAQAFANFGSDVVLLETRHGVLPREERSAAEIVEASLEADGVRVLCCGKELQVHRTEQGGIRLSVQSHGQSYEEVVDELLVAAGRAPNVESLGLEAAGVEFDLQSGVQVDDRLRTSNRHIYAAGDVCSPYKFTHAADFMARIVAQNALFPARAKMSRLTIPWCTFTAPELARVGLSADEARERGVAIDTYQVELSENDRAVLEGETQGRVVIHTARGKDTILGATIVAAHAGDLISEVSLAMTHGLGLKQVANAIHPYPTQADAIRRTGDLYNRSRLTPFKQRLLKLWFAWTR